MKEIIGRRWQESLYSKHDGAWGMWVEDLFRQKGTIEEAIKSKEYSHTIELEEYELTVGDSILFYAEATG